MEVEAGVKAIPLVVLECLLKAMAPVVTTVGKVVTPASETVLGATRCKSIFFSSYMEPKKKKREGWMIGFQFLLLVLFFFF